MRARRLLLLCAAVAPSLGYTDCNYFSTVTVPAADTSRPVLATRMWIGGVESIQLGWADEVVTDPLDAASIFIAPAVWDGGGARTLDLDQEVTVWCDGDGLGQVTFVNFFHRSTSQSGWPGSSVSTGMYLVGDVFDLTAYDYCGSGFTLSEVDYGWTVTGTDFFGNAGDVFSGSIVYLP